VHHFDLDAPVRKPLGSAAGYEPTPQVERLGSGVTQHDAKQTPDLSAALAHVSTDSTSSSATEDPRALGATHIEIR